MNQAWNIFRKDARRHWPEIAASLAALLAFAWLDIREWSHRDSFTASGFSILIASRFLPGLINALLPISWMFLIVRVVQSESLVGDRQFWIIRPYDWKQLVAAKALFVLAFINLPFFITDIFLLAQAGFHPAHYVVGLLWMQLMWILFLFLSAAALATVTKNIPQMLLAVLLIALYLIGMVALSQVIPSADAPSGGDSWLGLLEIGTALAVIFLQYSRRKVALSRWLIVGFCALMTLMMVATPHRSLVARAYPLANGNLPVQLALMPVVTHDSGSYSAYDGRVPISFPLSVSGLPQDSFLQLNGMIVTLTNADGFRWDSGWKVESLSIFPDQKKAQISFDLKQNAFDRLKSAPVTAHLLLAFTLYHSRNQREFTVPNGEFAWPDVGLCFSETQYWNRVRCRVPLRKPTSLLITSETAASTCPVLRTSKPPKPGVFAHATVWGDSDPAEMGISPVHEVDIYLTDWDQSDSSATYPGVCPGTPLVLSDPEMVGRSRLELDLENLSLADYAVGSGFGRVVLGH
jgi:hypothetical protein